MPAWARRIFRHDSQRLQDAVATARSTQKTELPALDAARPRDILGFASGAACLSVGDLYAPERQRQGANWLSVPKWKTLTPWRFLFWRLKTCADKLSPEVRRPTMDTLTELRHLADDLTELGDIATAALVRQAMDRFSAWKFEAGERLLERALEERHKHEDEPPRSPYFNTCARAFA